MRIAVELAFDEQAAVRLLNWLAGENRRIFWLNRSLPNLYDSGIVYRREVEEVWSDVINTLLQGHEDCDALAAYRAGELQARGAAALSIARGDSGARKAKRMGLRHIDARVVLRTRSDIGRPGLYHCIVKYRVGRRWYYDDPSIRLGMRGYINLRQPDIQALPPIQHHELRPLRRARLAA